MMKFIVFFLIVIAGLTGTVAAQETTAQPESPSFALEFPLAAPSDEQLQEAFECVLAADSASSNAVEVADTTACGLAKQALSLARAREHNSDPSAEEIALLTQIASANPALLDINLIAAYYNAAPLVAPPAFTDQPITSISLHYSFGGMGNSVDYTVKIVDANSEPIVTGHVENSGGLEDESTPAATTEAVTLPDTIDVATIQAFAPALRDLLPISTVFSMTPCWDYYPDWTVILTFADGTVATMVTQQSNVIGIGGPWQIEIDGRAYLQYSGAFAEAVTTLLDTMNLPLGTTAAMGCGEIDNPLHLAFPDFKAN